MTTSPPLLDIAWILICAALVMLMQAGFSCLESGLVRTKNSINVAIKNFTDFCVSSAIFWLFGFALMFGASYGGIFGSSGFFFSDMRSPWLIAFFIFQVGFCGTATTIVSGAVAERMRFGGYLVIATILSALIYPVIGHWAWGSVAGQGSGGWLEGIGFIDFAGGTVVHSVGGWVSLAAIIIIGPRLGRFGKNRLPIHGHDLPVATLGVFLLWFGWFGFNGGSTFGFTPDVPLIIFNTSISGTFGGLVALGLSWRLTGRPDAGSIMNGALAGLVGVTASAHIITPVSAVGIGCIASLIMYGITELLVKLELDDVVGAVPVHLGAGIWGTLAVALFGDLASFSNGLDRWQQLAVQATGVGVTFVWAFGLGFILLWFINRWYPLRIDPEGERIGLNVAEHGASTEILDLLTEMDTQARSNDYSGHVNVEPHTEIGQIAQQYNRVLDNIKKSQEKREAESRRARETLEDAIETLSEGFILYDADDRFILCNQRYREFNQTSADKLNPGISWREFLRTGAERGQYKEASADLEGYVEKFSNRRLKVGERESTEFQQSDGRWIISEHRRTRQGGMVGISIDITQRKEMEDTLRKSEALIRHVLEACPIPIGMYRTEDGSIIYENPCAKALYGRGPSTSKVIARQDFANPGERNRYMSHIHRHGSVDGLELQLKRSDGSKFWAAVSSQPIDYQDEEAVVSATLDLTERQALELEMTQQREALHQSEKLSALGELLAGVAHELNNPLSVLVGQAVLLEETASDQRVVERAKRIGNAADRCARIVKTFLAMARQQPIERKASDMNEIIEAALEVTGYALRSANIDVNLELAPDLPLAFVDASQINQVLTNLIVNAQHALEETDEPRELSISSTFVDKKNQLVIEVKDNGPGIPEDIRTRIFEPFFTTKEVGTGTGIGLAACHRIVESHSGSISVDGLASEGARFVIRLPMAEIQEVHSRPTDQAENIITRQLSVLVIDDVPEIAEMLSEILRAENHRVDCVNSAAAALELLEQQPFDVILSDLRMPGLEGQDFFEILGTSRPELVSRLVFITGDTMSPKSSRFLQSTGRPFIEKPITPQEVRDLVYLVAQQNNPEKE